METKKEDGEARQTKKTVIASRRANAFFLSARSLSLSLLSVSVLFRGVLGNHLDRLRSKKQEKENTSAQPLKLPLETLRLIFFILLQLTIRPIDVLTIAASCLHASMFL